jgi:GNAT superfamily N-acetyltransferase
MRPVRAEDGGELESLYASLSDDSRYLRFFSPATAEAAARIGPRLELDQRHFGLVAEVGDRIVGVADYYRTLDDVAEVAFTVRDDQHGRGIGTLLLDHLAEIAVAKGIRCFVAQVLSKNDAMRAVFEDAGFEVSWSRADLGTIEVSLDLARTEQWADAHSERERTAEALSIARLLSPRSIAVVGASRHRDTIGNSLLRNLLSGGFTGSVYPVNPKADAVAGVHAYPTVLAIPEPVDPAVVAVPGRRRGGGSSAVRDEGRARGRGDLERLRRARRRSSAGWARPAGPPLRDATGGPELFRCREHEPGCEHERDVRAGRPHPRKRGFRIAIWRCGYRTARSHSVARPRCVHLRLAREQGGRQQQRSAPVLGP